MVNKAYSDSQFKSYGNLPTQKACGGCGPASPCDAFHGSYVPPKYLTRSCLPQYHSGYPSEASWGYTKKAPMPTGIMSQDQVSAMGGLELYGSCAGSACNRGIDSAQLYSGPIAGCEGCGFDDVYVDSCRDVAQSDMLHTDYTNVISTTYNQVYDTRGPVDCSGSCESGCPVKQYQGLYGKDSPNNEDNWLFTMATRGAPTVAANKPYRGTSY